MIEFRKPPIGSRPGTIMIDPESPHSKLYAMSYDETSLTESEPSLDQLRDLVTEGRRLWLDVQGLGDEELLRRVADVFSIHPLALEDIVHIPNRPKAEEYEHNLLIVTRMLQDGEDRQHEIEQVSLVVGRDYIVTFQEQHGDVLDPVRRRLRGDGSRMRVLSSDYLAYAILDTIIDAYFPVVERIGDRIEEMEDLVLFEATPELLQELNSIRARLLNIRRAVAPQREAVNTLVRADAGLMSQEVRMYLRDTYDHIVQTSDAVETARELVNGLMNTYLSVLSNRMNEIMKTLTIVASIFVPLTFMAGIYGMNFDHMPELHVRWAYPALLVTMGVILVGMVAYFWRKGWIGRGR